MTKEKPMDGGLAAQMAQQEMGNTTSITLEQVIEALLNGVDPETLLQQGVPIELLKQAAELILAQTQGDTSVQAPVTPSGQEIVASEGLAHRLTK